MQVVVERVGLAEWGGGQGRVERPGYHRQQGKQNEVRSEGSPCPHHHLSCIHCHKGRGTRTRATTLPQLCRDPQS